MWLLSYCWCCQLNKCLCNLPKVHVGSAWVRWTSNDLKLAWPSVSLYSLNICYAIIWSVFALQKHSLIGASQSEPQINGTAVHELHIYYFYGTSVTRNMCPAWLCGHRREIFYYTFSFLGHGLCVHCSNLANCRFTLMLLQDSYRHHVPWVNQRKVRLQKRTEFVVNHIQCEERLRRRSR